MEITWSRTLFRAFRLRLRLRRRAFRCIFARSAIASFAKDAAPIPNAKGNLIRGAASKVAETRSHNAALPLEKIRGGDMFREVPRRCAQRGAGAKQKSPSAMLRLPL